MEIDANDSNGLKKENKSIPSLMEGVLKDPKARKYAIIFAGLATFLSAFTTTAVTVAIPTIAKLFEMDAVFQNWIATIFLLAVAIFSVPFGKLSGKFGLKKFLCLGMITIGIGCAGGALAWNAETLLVFRAIQGIGSAMLSVSSMALVAQAIPLQERGKALGMNISAVYIGLTIGPVFGGFITQNAGGIIPGIAGWQWIFLIVIPFLILNLIIGFLKVPNEWKMGENDKFDYIGTLLYAIGIVFGIYGFTTINTLSGLILTIMGVIILIGFAIYELRLNTPVFEVKLFKNMKFTSATLAALISYLATFVVTYIITYHLQYIKGMDPQTSGIVLIVTSGLMAIVAPLSGRLSDKIDPQKLSALGMFLVAISLFMLSFLDASTPLYFTVIAMAIEGIGIGLFTTPNTNAIMGSIERKYTSIASATVATARVIGQTLSLGILTIIFAVIMGSSKIIPAVYPQLILSSKIAFIISTILCVIAIALSFVGIKSTKRAK
ncbi:MAG: MFS transporter [Methanobrevibacter sp.]|jgi:EmrB/QacA subfamily drug resistance transporter|nr:MFS transporter [Candidatus Methanoflexus mossambicus]